MARGGRGVMLLSAVIATVAMAATAQMFNARMIQLNPGNDLLSRSGREACSSKQVADVYLLVDGSTSVGPQNFNLVLGFLAKLVDKLDIGQDRVRVGMVQYSGDPRSPKIRPEFSLGQYADKQKLKAAILSTKYMRGFTFTGAALQHTLQLFRKEGRPGVGKILVLVTDGEANDKVKEPSDAVKSSGIVLFSVGVGKADRNELALMASPPAAKHMFHASDFSGLDSIITALTSTVCTVVQEAQTPAPTAAPGPFAGMDVIFAIDGSGGVAAADFALIKGFVVQIVQGLSVGATQVRVGLVQLVGQAGYEFKLGQFSSQQDVVAAVGKVSARGGARAIGATIQFVLSTAFSQGEGGRAGDGVPQVLVVITGGASSDAVGQYRAALRAQSVRCFVIGIGGFGLSDLQRLPSAPVDLHLYMVAGYGQLSGIYGHVTSVLVKPAVFLDLVFLVDGSLGAAWGAVRAFVSHLLLYVQSGGGVLRVAFVQFAGDVKAELYLDQGTDLAAVLNKLQSVQLSGAGGRNLGKAVSFVGGSVLSAAKGGRAVAGANQVVVLFTAGPSSDEPSQALYALKAAGVRVLALDLGGQAVAQLGGLVSAPFNLHYYKLTGGAQVLPLALGRVLHTVFYTGVTRGAQFADIVFYLDASTAVGNAGFESLRNFLVQILSYVRVGRYTVRVGVVLVGTKPSGVINFGSYSERSGLAAAVGQLKAIGGARNIGAALLYSLSDVNYFGQPVDDALQRTQVGILLTGGASADGAASAAAQLQARGVRLFVVGLGAGVDQSFIQGVASFPYGLHSFTANDYAGLSSVTTTLVTYIFRAAVSGDLVFLIDGSAGVEQQTFVAIKKFVERVITHYYRIGGSLRVAVYQTGGAGRLEVPLGNQIDGDSLQQTILNIQKVSGPRNLGASLTYVLNNVYKETSTAKVSQSIFILSGGKWDDDVTGSVQLLRERGISVTGLGPASSQLDTVVSSSSRWFQFTDSSTIFTNYYKIVSGLFFTVPVVPIPKTTPAPTTPPTTTPATTTPTPTTTPAPTTLATTTLAPTTRATTTPILTTTPARTTAPAPTTVASPYNIDNRYADVVLVVDGSSGVSLSDFGTIRTIVSQIVTRLQVAPDDTRVAVVIAAGVPNAPIYLNSYPGKDELLVAVERLNPAGGVLNLGAALQLVVDGVLKPGKGSRIQMGAPTLVVTILGGKPADDVSGPVATLNGLGVRHVVLSGGYQDTKVLSGIATSSRLVKTWSSFQSILNFNLGQFVYRTKERASVVFVVDTSSSITADELKAVRTFIVGIAYQLNLAPDSVRLSVVSYGADYHKLVAPAEINSPTDLEAKLGSVLVPTGGAANTGKALAYVITDLLAKEPDDVNKNVVLITSGPSSDSVAPIPELLQKNVVSLFAVGVKKSDLQQLQTLVSRGGYYYQLSDYSLLSLVKSQIITKALYLPAIQKTVTTTVVITEPQYKLVPGNRDADVVFVVDGSSGVSDANFGLVRTIVSQIITGLDVGPDATRVALVTVGGTPRADVFLNSFPGKAELLAVVGKLAPVGGPCNLGAALQLVVNGVLKPEKGSRIQLGSPTIVYTILGGKPADDVAAGANLLRGMGVLVSAFGAGYQDSSVLSSVATSSSQVFTWSSFQELVTKSSSLTGNSLYLPKTKTSVTFVVDTSISITADELKVVRAFIVGMASRLNLAPDSVRLSVVSYGADYHKLVAPAQINSPKDLEAKLGSVLVPTGGATNTGKALTYVITDLLAKEPDDVNKNVVLITSGPSSDSVAPIPELLQKNVVSLFAVGVKKSDVKQLQTLVSRGGYYYQLSDYSLLFRLQGQMVNRALYLPAIVKTQTTQLVIDTNEVVVNISQSFAVGPTGIQQITCTTLAKDLLSGSTAMVFCPPGCESVKGPVVKGSYVYSVHSMVCAAATHAGVIIPTRGGTVSLAKTPGLVSFDGSTDNGIKSTPGGGEPLSFVFKGCPCA